MYFFSRCPLLDTRCWMAIRRSSQLETLTSQLFCSFTYNCSDPFSGHPLQRTQPACWRIVEHRKVHDSTPDRILKRASDTSSRIEAGDVAIPADRERRSRLRSQTSPVQANILRAPPSHECSPLLRSMSYLLCNIHSCLSTLKHRGVRGW